MKLTQAIKIKPPPYSDNAGNIVDPPEINTDEINFVFIDNPSTKTVLAQIFSFPIHIVIWSGSEYDLIGDWTKSQAEQKILTLLGDDPSSYIRSLYPKTLEEYPNHPGTVLSKMIKSVGIHMTDSCSCKRHALEMNARGNNWCEENIDTIIGWLREEANTRGIPFVDVLGKLLIGRAIKKSRKLLANQPVPENDEDLDTI